MACIPSIRGVVVAGLLVVTPAFGAIDLTSAASVFQQARAICDRDGGALCGRPLCGPILLLDPQDLALVVNQAAAGRPRATAGADRA